MFGLNVEKWVDCFYGVELVWWISEKDSNWF